VVASKEIKNIKLEGLPPIIQKLVKSVDRMDISIFGNEVMGFKEKYNVWIALGKLKVGGFFIESIRGTINGKEIRWERYKK
jgi:hypothetical protein